VDFDMEWINLYNALGAVDIRHVQFMSDSATPPILYGQRDGGFKDPRKVLKDSFQLLPLDVSFRIAAIRETFEEVGILLCKKVDKSSAKERGIGRGSSLNCLGKSANFVEIRDPDEIEEWQLKVKKDPQKGFLALCHHYGCLPDLNALVEWSNWLTPSCFGNKRFDTIFYIASLPFTVPYLIDEFEVATARVSL
jgi:hypothetical protein